MSAKIATFALLLLVFGCSGERPGERQAAGAGTVGTAGPQSTDELFLREATSDGLVEVQLAGLAAERARDEEVKGLARHLLEDHRQANRELQEAAVAAGLPSPAELLAEHRHALDRIGALEGAAFDRAFVEFVVTSHQASIELFERQTQEGSVSQLRIVAERTLPRLRQHLEHAHALHARLEGGRPAGSRPQPERELAASR